MKRGTKESGAQRIFAGVQVLRRPGAGHQKEGAFPAERRDGRLPHPGAVGHLVHLPGHRHQRHHLRRPAGRRHGKHAGQSATSPALAPEWMSERGAVRVLWQGVLESFLGTAVAGGVFCLLAGQPLTILSSTGPVLVFERLLFNFSKSVSFGSAGNFERKTAAWIR